MDYKKGTQSRRLDLEFKLYTETHTKDILTIERQVFYDKVSNLKNEN